VTASPLSPGVPGTLVGNLMKGCINFTLFSHAVQPIVD